MRNEDPYGNKIIFTGAEIGDEAFLCSYMGIAKLERYRNMHLQTDIPAKSCLWKAGKIVSCAKFGPVATLDHRS